MYAYKNESIKLKFNYLLGHRRALCPSCQYAPQSRERFTGGSSLTGGGGCGGGTERRR